MTQLKNYNNEVINQQDIDAFSIDELIKNNEVYYGSFCMDARVHNSLYLIAQYIKLTKEYYKKCDPNDNLTQLTYDNVLKAVELAEQLMP